MSLVDPGAARAQRTARRRPVVRAVLSALLLSTFAVAGYGWGRVSVIGADHVDGLLLTVTVIGSILSWMSLLLFGIAIVGRWRAAPFVVALGFVLLGSGLAIGSADGRSTWHEFPGWLAAVFLGTGLLLIALAVLGRTGARRRRERVRDVVETGTRVAATVTDVPRGPDPTSRGLWARVGFTFHDHTGTQRWVERMLLIRREGDVKVGDTTTLWYDHADPGNDRRIVVELARDNPLTPAR